MKSRRVSKGANAVVWCTWHQRDCLKRFGIELVIEDRLLLGFEYLG
jgi:hypothetical protein